MVCEVMLCHHVILEGKTLPHDNTALKVAGVTDGSRIMLLGKKVRTVITIYGYKIM